MARSYERTPKQEARSTVITLVALFVVVIALLVLGYFVITGLARHV
jgi:hypothetical protein